MVEAKVPVGLRLKPSLKERVKAHAEAKGISESAAYEELLGEALDDAGQPVPPPPTPPFEPVPAPPAMSLEAGKAKMRALLAKQGLTDTERSVLEAGLAHEPPPPGTRAPDAKYVDPLDIVSEGPGLMTEAQAQAAKAAAKERARVAGGTDIVRLGEVLPAILTTPVNEKREPRPRLPPQPAFLRPTEELHWDMVIRGKTRLGFLDARYGQRVYDGPFQKTDKHKLTNEG